MPIAPAHRAVTRRRPAATQYHVSGLHGLFTTPRYLRGMFEGPIRAADHASGEDLPILRQLRWSDLVARLAATRQVRSPGAPPAEEHLASFASFHRDGDEESQRGINRDALRHGKLRRIMTPHTVAITGEGDRET